MLCYSEKHADRERIRNVKPKDSGSPSDRCARPCRSPFRPPCRTEIPFGSARSGRGEAGLPQVGDFSDDKEVLVAHRLEIRAQARDLDRLVAAIAVAVIIESARMLVVDDAVVPV